MENNFITPNSFNGIPEFTFTTLDPNNIQTYNLFNMSYQTNLFTVEQNQINQQFSYLQTFSPQPIYLQNNTQNYIHEQPSQLSNEQFFVPIQNYPDQPLATNMEHIQDGFNHNSLALEYSTVYTIVQEKEPKIQKKLKRSSSFPNFLSSLVSILGLNQDEIQELSNLFEIEFLTPKSDYKYRGLFTEYKNILDSVPIDYLENQNYESFQSKIKNNIDIDSNQNVTLNGMENWDTVLRKSNILLFKDGYALENQVFANLIFKLSIIYTKKQYDYLSKIKEVHSRTEIPSDKKCELEENYKTLIKMNKDNYLLVMEKLLTPKTKLDKKDRYEIVQYCDEQRQGGRISKEIKSFLAEKYQVTVHRIENVINNSKRKTKR